VEIIIQLKYVGSDDIYHAAVRTQFLTKVRNHFELEIDTPLTLGNVPANFGFLRFFGCRRQTDEWTYRRASDVMRLSRHGCRKSERIVVLF